MSELAFSEIGGQEIAVLQQMRRQAAAEGRALWDVLAEQFEETPAACVAYLSRVLHWPGLGMERLYTLEPVFDLLPYAEAVCRHCLVARDEAGVWLGVVTDPFDLAFVDFHRILTQGFHLKLTRQICA